MGCDTQTHASLLQIRDTAARAVESCVGPQGQTPGRAFNALAFFEDEVRSDWWVTIGRPNDILYYYTEVEDSLNLFMVRAAATTVRLLEWVCCTAIRRWERCADTASPVLSISFSLARGEGEFLLRL